MSKRNREYRPAHSAVLLDKGSVRMMLAENLIIRHKRIFVDQLPFFLSLGVYLNNRFVRDSQFPSLDKFHSILFVEN